MQYPKKSATPVERNGGEEWNLVSAKVLGDALFADLIKAGLEFGRKLDHTLIV